MVSTAMASAFQVNVCAMLINCSRACGVVTSAATLAIGDTTTSPMPMPQPRIATRWSRRVLSKTLLNHTLRLLGGRAVGLVVAQEDVLEAGLVAGERDDLKACGSLDHRIGRSLHRQAHGVAVVQRLHVGHALQRLEGLGRNPARERDRDRVALAGLDLGPVTDPDNAPVADDPYALARLLDLAPNVLRDEHPAPAAARLFA